MSQAGYHPVLDPEKAPPFPQAVLPVLRNPQLRKNVAHAIDVIQAKRGAAGDGKDRLAGAAFGWRGNPYPCSGKSGRLPRAV